MPNVHDYFKSENYQQLLGKIKPLLNENPNALIHIDPLRLKNYWSVGRKIAQAQKRSAALQSLHLRSPALLRLAKDLKAGVSNLYRMILFYRTWPQAAPVNQKNECLSWGHHCELLAVKEEECRHYYHDRALAENWKRDALRSAIKMNLFSQIKQSGKHGLIPEQKTPFYTYKAIPLRILDGDTFAVKIQLGFQISCEPILRLRGINTPELSSDPTGRAQKAKARLEEILRDLECVVLKTYKTDVYGRYLADVYYHPTLKNEEEILKQGTFLNQQLLDEGLGDWMVI